MITEDYVSFETAKLLKEKGFDGLCRTAYETITGEHEVEQCSPSSWGELNQVKRPSLQMAIKWLDEVHHILVVSDYEYEFTDTSWYFKIYRLGKNGKPDRVPVKGVSYDDSGEHEHIVGYRDYKRSYKDYATREEAEDDAIRYCLENLI